MVGRLVLQMKHWGKSIEYFIDFIFVAVTYAFLLSIFQPSLLLSDTFITGGDTGSHMYPAWYMRQYLLPHLKLFGWSMDWYGGFPIFEYYFPLPFAVAALMSYVISFNISFKLVTAFGVFLLPIASYAYMRLVGFKHPAPALACVFSLCLLFNEEYSIWGGNIKSTLAGQFTFTWGQALAVLFMGLVYSFVESKKHFLKSAIVLAAIPICHIYTLIWAVSSSMPIVISRAKKDFIAKANRLWAVYICGFLLSAFWSMNTVAKLGWSTAFGAWRSQSIWEVVPNILLPFYPLAIAAVFYFLYKPSRKLGYLLSITISPILFFAFIKLSSTEHLLDVRFMPFAYLGILYLSAYVLSKIIRSFRGVWISSIIVLLISMMWVTQNMQILALSRGLYSGVIEFSDPTVKTSIKQVFSLKYDGAVPSWVSWNYKGYDVLTTWPGVKKFFDYLSTLPDGRVVHEFSSAHDQFGTPRTLELIPFFGKHPVLEGLNIESAASSPFHFFMQSEYSKAATCPLSYMRCTRFNFEDAKKHFRYFAPKYVVASSDMLKNALVQDGGFRHLKSFEYDLDVYELSEEIPLVEVPYYLPVLVVSDDWRQAIMSWWKKPDAIDVPLAVAKSSDETDMGRFAAVVGDGFNPEALARMETGAGCEVSYAVGNEFVDVNTSCPGKPHIVKVTYNPGWSVTGADKIYLAGPAFMLVYPAGNSFKLTYGLTPLGYLGYLMTFLGLVVCISYVLWSRGYLNDSRFSHGFSKFCTKLVDMEYSLLDVLSNLLRHWRKLLALAFAVLILHYLSGIYSTMQVECADLCSEMGYSGGSGSFSGIFSTGDHFDMGFDNVAENEGHELVCTAACDKSRGDFVYVNFGMISFNMASKPGVNHRLSFLVDDSHWCRTADIYFNGKYLDTLSQSDSKVGWNKRSYFIPKELITSASSNIILNHSRNDCWGVDVSDAWLEPIECSCS